MKRWLFNHPNSSAALVTLVILVSHAYLSGDRFDVYTPHEMLAQGGASTADIAPFYIGSAFVAALIGSFGGMLVVFAMTQGLTRFARMRLKGGRTLEANWIHPILASFVAGLALLVAAGLNIAGYPEAGGWTFEAGLVLCVHAAGRLVWLLHRLVRTVRGQDKDALMPKPDLRALVPDAS